MHYQQQQAQQPSHYPNSLGTHQYDQYQNNYANYAQPNPEIYAQVPPSANNFDTNRFGAVNDSKDEADSPVLRALLNGKRVSPSYIQSPSAKRQKTQENHYAKVSLENGSISPVRTEDSLDYFDDYAFEKQRPITEKSGYEYGSVPMGMTGENLNAASSIPPISTTPLTTHTVNSPIVDGISTPPQTPKSTIEHVNQVSKMCDASSASDSNAWTQNGNDCKYLRYLSVHRQTHFFIHILPNHHNLYFRVFSLPFHSRHRQRETITSNIHASTNAGAGERIPLQSVFNASTSC